MDNVRSEVFLLLASSIEKARAQLSPRLARLFVVSLVDLVRNVRDGKPLQRNTLPHATS